MRLHGEHREFDCGKNAHWSPRLNLQQHETRVERRKHIFPARVENELGLWVCECLHRFSSQKRMQIAFRNDASPCSAQPLRLSSYMLRDDYNVLQHKRFASHRRTKWKMCRSHGKTNSIQTVLIFNKITTSEIHWTHFITTSEKYFTRTISCLVQCAHTAHERIKKFLLRTVGYLNGSASHCGRCNRTMFVLCHLSSHQPVFIFACFH